MENDKIQPWDTLQITASGGVDAVAIHIYPSGNIKVRCPSGHIIIIRPSEVIANLGYRQSEYDGLIAMLINNKYYGYSK